MNWLKRHLNWTWFFFYILTLGVAFSVVIYVVRQPPPMTTELVWENMTMYMQETIPNAYMSSDGKWHDEIRVNKTIVPSQYARTVIDEDAVRIRYLWFWPVYFIGVYFITRWVLRQKSRNRHWLWLTLLLFVFTPLILSNKSTAYNSCEEALEKKVTQGGER